MHTVDTDPVTSFIREGDNIKPQNSSCPSSASLFMH